MNKGFIGFIKENKKLWRVGVAVLVGILLIFMASAARGDPKESEETLTLEEYKVELDARVASMCSAVEGVGKCKVFITFERGEYKTYKGSVLTESRPPKVLGVSVVCAGADSFYVQNALTEMLTALFDVGSNRIAVLKLNS